MTFYVLGSPLGNLGDVSYRFITIISELDYLVAEDTKKAGQLMQLLAQRYNQPKLLNKKMMAYFREVEGKRIEQVIALLQQGQNVGLLSEAGMPGIADPGNLLVDAVQRYGFPVEVIPGPSALTTALSLCGYSGTYSIFLGFLPKKKSEQLKLWQKAFQLNLNKAYQVVFYESAKRIRETVKIIQSIKPQGKIFLGREMTKQNQQLIWTNLKQLNPDSLVEKGEYTGIVFVNK
jgi:16S rRNA (cytidine1402-2'-O)-methyltransferase